MTTVKNIYKRELSGSLIRLSIEEVICIKNMRLDKKSEENLLRVLNEKEINGPDVQDIFIEELVLGTKDADIFRASQSPVVLHGSRYELSGGVVNTPRYKADMDGLTLIGEKLYMLDIKLGSIKFDLGDKIGMVIDDDVIFENVSAMLFPEGRYSVVVKGIED